MPDKFAQEATEHLGADGLLADDDARQTYGRDWTQEYQASPAAVAFPKSAEEVAELLALCSKHNVAVVPSGGRTGLAGGAVAANGELVLSLEKLNGMGPVDTLARTVTVGAGAITQQVHEHCQEHGVTWPVDFASAGSSQIGGNIATNAGGIRVVRYGLTRQWVLGLEVALMDGSLLKLNGALEKNNTGIDLRQVFIGSEGTLGVITQATLKLAPVPGESRVFFVGVSSMKAALELFEYTRTCQGFALSAFEYLTHECLEVTAAHVQGGNPLQTKCDGYVLLDLEPETGQDQAVERWLETAFEKELVLDGVAASSERESAQLWALRENQGEALAAKGLLHKNDIALPIAQLSEFTAKLDSILKQEYPDFGVYVFGHLGDGNLHVNIMKPKDLEPETFWKACHEVDEKLFALLQDFNGSISAEHGIGLLKKPFLHYSRSQKEIALMQSMKKVFDPKGLLNPGKIF